MDIENLSTIVALLVALSVAAERLVEIIKNVVPFLRDERKDNAGNIDSNKEGLRKTTLQVLAVVAGVGTAFLARPAIEGIAPGVFSSIWGILALGLLASGGSGFWNSVATYVLKVKDIKAGEAVEKQAVAEAAEAERAEAEVRKLEAQAEARKLAAEAEM